MDIPAREEDVVTKTRKTNLDNKDKRVQTDKLGHSQKTAFKRKRQEVEEDDEDLDEDEEYYRNSIKY